VHFLFLLASLAMLAVTAQFVAFPITPGAIWKPVAAGSSPEWRVIAVLAVSVGFPFLILSRLDRCCRYGSVALNQDLRIGLRAFQRGISAGLLSYPFLAERFLVLRTQAWGWSVVYGLFLFAYGACAWGATRECLNQ